MPTKRRKIAPTRHDIRPEAIEAWRRGDWMELHRSLGLRPWECSPLDAIGEPPANGTAYATSWPRAVELRRELIELADQLGRRPAFP